MEVKKITIIIILRINAVYSPERDGFIFVNRYRNFSFFRCSLLFVFFLLFLCFSFFNLLCVPQIHILGHLYGRDGHQNHIQRIHTEQVHVLTESVELAGFHCHHVGLRHHRHGCRQLGWAPHVPRASCLEDRLYNARYVALF